MPKICIRDSSIGLILYLCKLSKGWLIAAKSFTLAYLV